VVSFTSVATPKPVDLVVEQIRSRIARGELQRAQKLPTERELALLFGVSRGVVREAIKVLNGMGLVDSRQGSGIFVRNDPVPVISQGITLSVAAEDAAVNQLFEFRDLLESHAARCAATLATAAQLAAIQAAAAATSAAAAIDDQATFGVADRQFHLAVAEASNNPYLVVVLRAVWQIQGDVVSLLAQPKLFMTNAGVTHGLLADAITARDSAAAAEIMHAHVSASGNTIRESLSLDADLGEPEQRNARPSA
jgi:GntR family transcriptional repressor for pyruvate dehydrogenase complex